MSERLLSQLAHVEVVSPVPEASLRFYTDVLGLHETARVGQSVYLRGWGDYFHHCLKLTEAPHAGLGHIGSSVTPRRLLSSPPTRAARSAASRAASPPARSTT
jgi:catechol 2,3-dioxygenase-like lactoylglutathione lyase family enzyme